MAKTLSPKPGLIWGPYPEKVPPNASRPWQTMARWFKDRLRIRRIKHYVKIAEHSLQYQETLRMYGDPAFQEEIVSLRRRVGRMDWSADLNALVFAVVCEVFRRRLHVDLFPTQRLAAAIMLDDQLAEMATGEGKTYAVALAAASAALLGIPVHVITANDYLVARDAQRLAPVYHALGLSVGYIQQEQTMPIRRQQYGCDITYCTAKELVFDYLRDRPRVQDRATRLAWHAAALQQEEGADATLLRGLCMAIVDEADSILIDEARVPLILSERTDNAEQNAALSNIVALAGRLEPDRHFTLNDKAMAVELTVEGRRFLDASSNELHPIWLNRHHRDEHMATALAALHLYRRDRHYLVRDDAVHIIDETTGRLSPGRSWSRGLHQFIEIKEGVTVTGDTVTRAQITYQRFFPRYLRLCGMSGTLQEARSELMSVYRLPVIAVPLRKPSRRIDCGMRLFVTRHQQYRAVVERVMDMLDVGRPVLIGMDSVAEADALSRYLRECRIPHQVLNARNDEREADIVARAGYQGQVTVTTNIAGRGTDIPLGPGVEALGGLHVISCQINAARRIDRQLKGRCARQGDPGSAEALLTLDSERLRLGLPALIYNSAEPLARNGELSRWIGRTLVALVIRREEARQRMQREQLRHLDAQLDRVALFKD